MATLAGVSKTPDFDTKLRQYFSRFRFYPLLHQANAKQANAEMPYPVFYPYACGPSSMLKP
jgi:hypothetical protein